MKNSNTLQARLLLHAVFPGAIVPPKTRKKPLKIGISKDVIAWARDNAPGLSKRLIQKMFKEYCTGARYLVALKEGAPRFDLNGETVGFVTAEEAESAAKRLAKRNKYVVLAKKEKRSDDL